MFVFGILVSPKFFSCSSFFPCLVSPSLLASLSFVVVEGGNFLEG